ncbi:ABC transporter substrate-binding protein [Comamonas sp.]|uniref:ABC transporter substrate-binding protein n=1 Tax=Comamonas sp. TaxID=34028 RepID=UPI0028AFC23D|nr:ABC transporter substrate-binding protein [Comamonas sp.]
MSTDSDFSLATRRHFMLAAAASGLGTAVPSLAWAQDKPQKGGTLNLLLFPEPPTLTTIAHTAGSSVTISGKVTEGLLTYDFNLNPQPQLAVAWTISPDGLVYRFQLRQGVKWHDGKPFTSADVVHSIALLKEFHPRGRATFAGVAEVQAPDAHTVVLQLSRPIPYLITALAASESPIVPKHLYASGRADTNPANNAPVGTGPFVFKEWVRGSHVIYERNPHYWDGDKPYIDRLVVRFIPDAAARTAAIESGQVQIAPSSPVPFAEVERLRAKPGLQFETRGYEYINSVYRLEFNLESEPLKDLRVRQAIAHALQRENLLKVAWYGQGRLTTGPVHPALKKFYVPDLPVLPYDLKRAEKLLDDAGLTRGKSGGQWRARLNLTPIPNEGGQRTGDFLKQALGRIGIDVQINSQDFATYIKRIYTDRAFDLHVSAMSNTFDPTVGIQRLYWSKSFQRGLPFSNGAHYASPEVDRLLESAAVELNEAQRIREVAEFQKHIATDLPDITLVAPDIYTIADKRVRNHTVGADGVAGNLAGVWLAAS